MILPQLYANARRHHSAVPVHALGAQAALLPHHVRNRLGRWLAAAAGRPGRRLPQRPGKATRHVGTKHYVHVSRADSCGRGQHAVREDLLLHLQRLFGDPQRGPVRRRVIASAESRRYSRGQRLRLDQRPGVRRGLRLQPDSQRPRGTGPLVQQPGQPGTPASRCGRLGVAQEYVSGTARRGFHDFAERHQFRRGRSRREGGTRRQ